MVAQHAIEGGDHRLAARTGRCPFIELFDEGRDQLIRAAADQAADLALQHWELSRGHLEGALRPDPLPMVPVAPGEGAA